jgi:elongation factor Ts
MAEITAADVKKLRDTTGAGMMDCKKALTESNGDFDAAVDYLRKKGAKVAELRAGRDANEGVVYILTTPDNKFGIMVQVGCETDFVSKNDSFVSFAKSIAELALNNKIKNVDDLLAASLDGVSVKERIDEKVGSIGENISIQNYTCIEGECIATYNHNFRVGVMVALNKSGDDKFSAVGKDLAMQIAAMKPVAVDETSVTAEQKEREMAIAREKALADGKPENMIEKIAEGALNKFYKEFTLLKQDYIKDPKKSIAQLLKETDSDLVVTSFVRSELGAK